MGTNGTVVSPVENERVVSSPWWRKDGNEDRDHQGMAHAIF